MKQIEQISVDMYVCKSCQKRAQPIGLLHYTRALGWQAMCEQCSDVTFSYAYLALARGLRPTAEELVRLHNFLHK
jgi:hypothetical protein